MHKISSRMSATGLLLLTLLAQGACKSASRPPAELADLVDAARLMDAETGKADDLRVWVDTSLLLPYRAFAISLSGPQAHVRTFEYWPFSMAENRRIVELRLRPRCVGPLRMGSEVAICRESSRDLPGDLLSRVAEIVARLQREDLPREFGVGERNPDGSIRIVTDGTSVDLQLPPFTPARTATFFEPGDPGLCHGELCSLVAKLVGALEEGS